MFSQKKQDSRLFTTKLSKPFPNPCLLGLIHLFIHPSICSSLFSPQSSNHLPAIAVLPASFPSPCEPIGTRLLLLHLRLAVIGHVQRGVVVATVLHEVKFLSTELRGKRAQKNYRCVCLTHLCVRAFTVLTTHVTQQRRRVCMCVFTYRGLSCRQSSLPADVYESRCDDDHADGADDHQNHKQLAIIAACLTGPGLATAGRTVVLDAHLMKRTHAITQ